MSEIKLHPWGSESDAVPPGRYRHYKGGLYDVFGLAHLADGAREGEEAVVYVPLYSVRGQPVAVRSVASWLEPTAGGLQRFTQL